MRLQYRFLQYTKPCYSSCLYCSISLDWSSDNLTDAFTDLLWSLSNFKYLQVHGWYRDSRQAPSFAKKVYWLASSCVGHQRGRDHTSGRLWCCHVCQDLLFWCVSFPSCLSTQIADELQNCKKDLMKSTGICYNHSNILSNDCTPWPWADLEEWATCITRGELLPNRAWNVAISLTCIFAKQTA